MMTFIMPLAQATSLPFFWRSHMPPYFSVYLTRSIWRGSMTISLAP